MSDTIDNPLRRGLLARGTAALLTGAVIATTAHSAPVASLGRAGGDAELIALCKRQDVEWGLEMAIQAEGDDLPPGITAESRDQESRLAEADTKWWNTIIEISDTPARTAEGLRAKAEVMLCVLQRVVLTWKGSTLADIDAGDEGEIEDRMALSLARDVLAGRAAA